MVVIAAVIPFCWEVRIYNSFDLGFIVHFYLSWHSLANGVLKLTEKIDRTERLLLQYREFTRSTFVSNCIWPITLFYFFPCFRLFDEQLRFSSFPGTNNWLDNRIFINFLRFDVLAITSVWFSPGFAYVSFVYIRVLVADRRLGGHKLKFYFSQACKFAELKLQV